MLMQALGRISWIAAALVLLAACGNSTGPAVSRNNPGTGSATLKVTADIDANDDPTVIGGFSTDYSVLLRGGVRNPGSAATGTITNPSLGTIPLPGTGPGARDYLRTGETFPRGGFNPDVMRGEGK